MRLHRNLTHRVGYRHGQALHRYRCPWWSNKMIYAIAYSQGRKRGGEITELSCRFSAWISWAVAVVICGTLIIAMSWRMSGFWSP
jgi:putative copper export protein